MSLAEKLVSLRKQKGLTQMDLAERLNVSRQAISRWEVGAAVPSTENLKVLGELYGVRIDYLLDDEITELTENTQNPGDNRRNWKENLESGKNRKLAFGFVAVVVIVLVVLICTLVAQSKVQDYDVPIEDMHTGSKEDYSQGTFSFE